LRDPVGRLRGSAHAPDAVVLQRFFKTGAGEYGEGDVFLGVRVPAIRRLVREADAASMGEVIGLLGSRYHEERLLALLVLVRRFERGDDRRRREVFGVYLRCMGRVNNWDLVDLSAPNIVGGWLLTRPRGVLRRLVRSGVLWERRIAVLAFIRAGEYADTLDLCERLLGDTHDLMHKACGWMLREVGKRDRSALVGFLHKHASAMPRTMLRYAIERFPEAERRRWLAVRYRRRSGARPD
jgi:3-methyladenine DNA glycosylase AlkD